MKVQNKPQFNKKRQAGMSLLEIIIVLGIVGTIAAGVVVLAQRALDNKAVADLNTNLNSTRLALIDTFRTRGYPGEVNTVSALTPSQLDDPANHTAGNNPDPRISLVRVGAISTSELTNPMDGSLIKVASYTDANTNTAVASPATGKVFAITLTSLSSSQCSQVVETQVANWDYVEVDGTTALTGPSGALADTPTAGTLRTLHADGRAIPSVVEIADACAAANNNVILASR